MHRILCLTLAGTLTGAGYLVSSHSFAQEAVPRAVFKAHAGIVCSISFAPDGKTLATVGGDLTTVHIWDALTCRLKSALKEKAVILGDIAFSLDGRMLTSPIATGPVCLRETATWKERLELGEDGTPANTVAFSPDGKSIAIARTDVELWDLSSSRRRFLFKGHDDEVRTLAFTSDGKRLASAGRDKTIRIWDVHKGKEEFVLPPTNEMVRWNDMIRTAVFAPDAKTLATGHWFYSICVWDMATRMVKLQLKGKQPGLDGLKFTPDGKVLIAVETGASSDPSDLRLWHATTGKELACWRCDKVRVRAMDLSPDGKTLATGNWEGEVKLWNVAELLKPKPKK